MLTVYCTAGITLLAVFHYCALREIEYVISLYPRVGIRQRGGRLSLWEELNASQREGKQLPGALVCDHR